MLAAADELGWHGSIAGLKRQLGEVEGLFLAVRWWLLGPGNGSDRQSVAVHGDGLFDWLVF